ncbi:MAG: hypothetical protein A2W85_02440 [Bacteroidetes bacterium GWF2_41_31]|nr:MAG: hypothetical protein A2W85_02440 [Bacteroidetes bacterium GWF2_41_31]
MMKTFFYRLFLFIIPVFLFVLVTLAYYFYHRTQVVSDLQQISDYECLIMGDSQMQRIKPEMFDKRTFNFASSAEHYYFTYQKLKILLSFKDNNIKQVLLGISVASFAPVYCTLFNTDYMEGQSSLSRYLYFIPLKDRAFTQVKDFWTRSMFKGIYNGPYWGGLKSSENENPDTNIINTIFETHYCVQKGEPRFSSEQLKYLTLINNLCIKNHVDLILLTLPYHQSYFNKIDSFYIQLFWHNIQTLNHVQCLNYLDDSISPSWMSDAVHLNIKGADYYSKEINDSINLDSGANNEEKKGVKTNN